jgi:hypothetical protein
MGFKYGLNTITILKPNPGRAPERISNTAKAVCHKSVNQSLVLLRPGSLVLSLVKINVGLAPSNHSGTKVMALIEFPNIF